MTWILNGGQWGSSCCTPYMHVFYIMYPDRRQTGWDAYLNSPVTPGRQIRRHFQSVSQLPSRPSSSDWQLVKPEFISNSTVETALIDTRHSHLTVQLDWKTEMKTTFSYHGYRGECVYKRGCLLMLGKSTLSLRSLRIPHPLTHNTPAPSEIAENIHEHHIIRSSVMGSRCAISLCFSGYVAQYKLKCLYLYLNLV